MSSWINSTFKETKKHLTRYSLFSPIFIILHFKAKNWGRLRRRWRRSIIVAINCPWEAAASGGGDASPAEGVTKCLPSSHTLGSWPLVINGLSPSLSLGKGRDDSKDFQTDRLPFQHQKEEKLSHHIIPQAWKRERLFLPCSSSTTTDIL